VSTLKIDGQRYDLLKQEYYISNGDANGHSNGHHLHESDWLDDGLLSTAGAQAVMEGAVRQILEAIGEDPERQGLQRTPLRVAKAYAELTSGYSVNAEALVNQAVFDVDYDEMVLVKDIDFFSLCEHHMLPFYGRAHVAYIPNGKVIGLSKIPRIVEMFARRLQVQERMTQQIADFLQQTLQPQGVAVVVEGQHMCAAMRGVKKANARMTTSAMLGSFKHNPQTRAEFLDHVGRHAHR
jgi:GTP cyclohydrolase I